MNERDVLRKAKEVLLDQGWNQSGDYALNGVESAPVCLVGAVGIACNGTPYCFSGTIPVQRLLANLLNDSPEGWNDDEARTLDEVIALLDRAIASLEPSKTPELVA